MNYNRLLRDLQPHLRALENGEATPDATEDATKAQQYAVKEITTQNARCVDVLFPELDYAALMMRARFVVVASRPKRDPLARRFVREALAEIEKAAERMEQ